MTIARDSILDLRLLADEWEAELEDSDELDRADLNQLLDETQPYRDLCDELGIETTPDALRLHGDMTDPTLIREDYFTEYAQELAEDIGAINSDAAWPVRCIDWEQAADELKMDYSTVEYAGDTYYIRS